MIVMQKFIPPPRHPGTRNEDSRSILGGQFGGAGSLGPPGRPVPPPSVLDTHGRSGSHDVFRWMVIKLFGTRAFWQSTMSL